MTTLEVEHARLVRRHQRARVRTLANRARRVAAEWDAYAERARRGPWAPVPIVVTLDDGSVMLTAANTVAMPLVAEGDALVGIEGRHPRLLGNSAAVSQIAPRSTEPDRAPLAAWRSPSVGWWMLDLGADDGVLWVSPALAAGRWWWQRRRRPNLDRPIVSSRLDYHEALAEAEAVSILDEAKGSRRTPELAMVAAEDAVSLPGRTVWP